MALYESVICGTLWASKKKDLADEDSESKQRRVNDLVLNEGTKSVNICFFVVLVFAFYLYLHNS